MSACLSGLRGGGWEGICDPRDVPPPPGAAAFTLALLTLSGFCAVPFSRQELQWQHHRKTGGGDELAGLGSMAPVEVGVQPGLRLVVMSWVTHHACDT